MIIPQATVFEKLDVLCKIYACLKLSLNIKCYSKSQVRQQGLWRLQLTSQCHTAGLTAVEFQVLVCLIPKPVSTSSRQVISSKDFHGRISRGALTQNPDLNGPVGR